MELNGRYEIEEVIYPVPPRGKVWRAHDFDPKQPAVVFEWRPDDQSMRQAAADFANCCKEVSCETNDAFECEGLYYLVVRTSDVTSEQAQKAIKILQSHNLFDGDWFKPQPTPVPKGAEPATVEQEKANKEAINPSPDPPHPILWVFLAAICVSVIAIPLAWRWAPPPTPQLPLRIKIGLYKSLAVFPGWWVARRSARGSGEFEVVIRDRLDDLFTDEFQAVVIPLTAIPLMLTKSHWEDAEIVRVLERSFGAEHLFVRENFDIANIQRSEEILCPQGSFSESLLLGYLDYKKVTMPKGHPRYTQSESSLADFVDQLNNESSPETSEKTTLSLDKYDTLAIPEPAASHIPGGSFKEISVESWPDYRTAQTWQLMVLVCRKDTLANAGLKKLVTHYIGAWTAEDDQELTRLMGKHGEEIKGDGFPLYADASDYQVEPMVSMTQPTGEGANIDFFYGCPIHGCENSFEELRVDFDKVRPGLTAEEVCKSNLAAIWPGKNTAEENQRLASLQRPPPDTYCSPDSLRVRGRDSEQNLTLVATISGFGINNTSLEALPPWSKAKLPAKLYEERYYCVIGYGDNTGVDDAINYLIAKGRAENVIKKLQKLVPAGHIKSFGDGTHRQGQIVEIKEYLPRVLR